MKRLLLLTCLLLSIMTVAAQDITGTWNGKLNLPNGTLTIVFHISADGNGYKTTLDSPDQGATGIVTGSTTFQGSTLTIDIPIIHASYKGELKADGKLHGTFTQGLPFPLELNKGKAAKLKRPQAPRPPYPYRTEDIKFKNKQAGITLAGTLTLPKEGKRFPAVILLTGSGPQNRDEEIMGHKPFLMIADYLTRNGIAVLRFDDRGVGKSEGNFQTATGADFTRDAEAALKYLQSRKEIDPQKTGLLGHSEGGTTAFTIAARNKNVAFVVSLAGTGVKGDSLMLKQAEAICKSQGMPASVWEKEKDQLRHIYGLLAQDKSPVEIEKELRAEAQKKALLPTMQANEATKQQIENQIKTMTSPWYLYFMRHDPAADLRKIKCPVLAVNGEKDIQVDAAMNLKAIEENIKSNGNKQVTTKRYPGLNHLFQHCHACTIAEYGQLEETISPEVLKDIAGWMLHITK